MCMEWWNVGVGQENESMTLRKTDLHLLLVVIIINIFRILMKLEK